MRWPENSECILAELEKLYKELDEELDRLGPACKACGKCCDFDNFGFVLYASSVEANYILSKTDTCENPASGKNVCPFLRDGKCTIRDLRTVGCRTFFCTFEDKEELYEIHNRYLKKLKDLSEKFNLKWDYMPLLEFVTR